MCIAGAALYIVEDESLVALDAKQQLEGLGYRVVGSATTGDVALRQVEELRPDLVLMDINLRGSMDGIETAAIISEKWGIPVVYLTAYADTDTVMRAKTTFPFGYVVKPFEIRELRSVVEMALQRHSLEVELRSQKRFLQELNAIGRAGLVSPDLETMIPVILDRLTAIFASDGSGFCLWDVDDNSLISSRATGLWQGAALDLCEPDAPWHAFLRQHADKVLVLENLENGVAEGFAWPDQLPGQAALGISLPLGPRFRGAVFLVFAGAHVFTSAELAWADQVGAHIALAVAKGQYTESLRRHAAVLEARNAELDAFAHTVAHDLKSPLGLVRGYAELLRAEPDKLSLDQHSTGLKVIQDSAEQMGKIVDALLLLSVVRSEDVELSVINMQEIVCNVKRRLKHLIEERQGCLTFPDAWPRALGYAPWIEEVWVNYLSNALQYGGTPPCIALGATESAGQVRFWVRDNGPGIAVADQAKLFVPFGRLTRPRSVGYGLGLSIVRRIIDKLGGTVGVESVPGQGSEFYFTLQVAD